MFSWQYSNKYLFKVSLFFSQCMNITAHNFIKIPFFDIAFRSNLILNPNYYIIVLRNSNVIRIVS